MKKLLLFPLLFLSFAQAETIPEPETMQCKVIEIDSGDTVTCLTAENQQVKIKLYQVESPTLEQNYGLQARLNLSSIVSNKRVTVVAYGIKDGKIQGIITTISRASCPEHPEYGSCGIQTNVNQQMIKSGYACGTIHSKKRT